MWISSSGWVDMTITDDTNATVVDIRLRIACLDFFCADSQRSSKFILQVEKSYSVNLTFQHFAGEPHLMVALIVPSEVQR